MFLITWALIRAWLASSGQPSLPPRPLSRADALRRESHRRQEHGAAILDRSFQVGAFAPSKDPLELAALEREFPPSSSSNIEYCISLDRAALQDIFKPDINPESAFSSHSPTFLPLQKGEECRGQVPLNCAHAHTLLQQCVNLPCEPSNSPR